MSTQDKIIPGITLAHSFLGVPWVFWVASKFGFPIEFVAANLCLVALGIAAGIGWLLRRRWGAYLTAAFYLVQLFHVLSPTFNWSFSLGFNLNIAVGWFGEGSIGLNLVALAMLLWSTTRACAPNNSFKPNPLRGSKSSL